MQRTAITNFDYYIKIVQQLHWKFIVILIYGYQYSKFDYSHIVILWDN